MRRAATVVSLFALLVWTRAALSDGMFMPPQSSRAAAGTEVASTAQKAILIEAADGYEVLLLQTTYEGPADDFAWVIPVPGQPGKEDVFPAYEEFIDATFGETAPRTETHIKDILGRAPRHDFGMAGMPPSAAPPTEGLMGGPPVVIVHERMMVGDYDVAILSATGPGVLTGWLRENGYQVPADSAGTLDPYVGKGWYFVALRMDPKVGALDHLLKDVAPIGIRFPADKLVFPLTISKASSRARTEILIVVLAGEPVRCDQLPEVKLPLRVEHEPGESYATIRRAALEKQYPGAIVEHCSDSGATYKGLPYVKPQEAEQDSRRADARPYTGPPTPYYDSPIARATGTRFWTWLERDDMEDLTFSHAGAADTFAILVTREGEAWYPWQVRAIASQAGRTLIYVILAAVFFLISVVLTRHWIPLSPTNTNLWLVVTGLFLLVALLSGIVVIVAAIGAVMLWLAASVVMSSAQKKRETPVAPWSISEISQWVLITAGMVFFARMFMHAWPLQSPYGEAGNLGHTMADVLTVSAPPLTLLFWLVLEVVWVSLVVSRMKATFRLKWTNLLLIGLAAGLPAFIAFIAVVTAQADARQLPLGGALPHASSLVTDAIMFVTVLVHTLTALSLVSVIVLVAVGPYVNKEVRRAAQCFAFALLSLAVAAIVLSAAQSSVSRAYAGGPARLSGSGLYHLDRTLRDIDRALNSFMTENGCYPATLADLAAQEPPQYGIDSSGNRVKLTGLYAGRNIRALPRDPLTGRSDTWVYEPTGTPMVDSGGYTITLEQVLPQHGRPFR